jgi:hypothetical protein
VIGGIPDSELAPLKRALQRMHGNLAGLAGEGRGRRRTAR